jgi:hypothetical protein
MNFESFVNKELHVARPPFEVFWSEIPYITSTKISKKSIFALHTASIAPKF